jgi:hypothetical protein
MTDRELLQMALDALEAHADIGIKATKQIEALRARLAQPEPEPFEYWNAVEGWVKIDEVRQHFDTAGCGTIYKTGGEGRVPLYTAPQREPVIYARKEGDLIVVDLPQVPTGSGGISKDTKREPILPGGGGGSGVPTIDGWPLYSGLPPQEEQGLTATPLPAIKLQDECESQYKSWAQSAQVIGGQYDPRRKWVGLTDETYWEMWVESPSDVLRFAHAIETKLREKNT